MLLHFLPGRIDICAGAAFGFQTELNEGKADAAIILQAAFAGQAVAAYAGVVRLDGFHNRRNMRFGQIKQPNGALGAWCLVKAGGIMRVEHPFGHWVGHHRKAG